MLLKRVLISQIYIKSLYVRPSAASISKIPIIVILQICADVALCPSFVKINIEQKCLFFGNNTGMFCYASLISVTNFSVFACSIYNGSTETLIAPLVSQQKSAASV